MNGFCLELRQAMFTRQLYWQATVHNSSVCPSVWQRKGQQADDQQGTNSQPTTVSVFHCVCTELLQWYDLKTEWGLQHLCGIYKQWSQLCSKDVTRSWQQRPESATETLTWHASKYKVHVNFPKGKSSKDWGCILRRYLFGGVWCTLHLLTCQVTVNYHKHFRSSLFSVCVMSFEHWLTPSFVDIIILVWSFYKCLFMKVKKILNRN